LFRFGDTVSYIIGSRFSAGSAKNVSDITGAINLNLFVAWFAVNWFATDVKVMFR
jgi:hypothetical protein